MGFIANACLTVGTSKLFILILFKKEKADSESIKNVTNFAKCFRFFALRKLTLFTPFHSLTLHHEQKPAKESFQANAKHLSLSDFSRRTSGLTQPRKVKLLRREILLYIMAKIQAISILGLSFSLPLQVSLPPQIPMGKKVPYFI